MFGNTGHRHDANILESPEQQLRRAVRRARGEPEWLDLEGDTRTVIIDLISDGRGPTKQAQLQVFSNGQWVTLSKLEY